jgi:hypothetical protein
MVLAKKFEIQEPLGPIQKLGKVPCTCYTLPYAKYNCIGTKIYNKLKARSI